ncbi:aminopeptidase, partial [Desulfovibrio sp. OttesenSCG-928-I05]|nr:aminopeptidase [Desulfovibrio sp. OttesenSCG-928-I05]
MNDYSFTPRSCWDVYGSPAHQKAAEALAKRYIDFLTRCKTERETVDYVRERLQAAGFKENGKGQKMFRTLQGKTIFAAIKGKASLKEGLRLICAHGDTPRLD